MAKDIQEAIADEILEYQSNLCGKLHLSSEALADIMLGKRIVEKLIFADEREKNRRNNHRKLFSMFKRVAVLGLVILLGSCIFVKGFADNMRERLLNIIPGYVSVSVETIKYTQISDLRGHMLPTKLPSGYHYRYHTKPGGVGLFYVEYENAEGSTIRYYYYPDGVASSHDAEYTTFHEIRYSGGIVRIGQDEAGKMIVFFPYGETDYIQMEFDEPITDRMLLNVIDSIEYYE